jgi:hypothetical protein
MMIGAIHQRDPRRRMAKMLAESQPAKPRAEHYDMSRIFVRHNSVLNVARGKAT